jgi:hypothetical protein
VGFKEIRAVLIYCLKNGLYDHEFREDMETRNCLFNGTVSVAEVIDMVLACSGGDLESSPLHGNSKVVAHVLKPKGLYSGWYIKFYYVDPNTIFISVHK